MEHGLTPSVLTARLVYSSAPEALQGAVERRPAGGGQPLRRDGGGLRRASGTDDRRRRSGQPRPPASSTEHRAARRPLPGFGHNLHVPDDPRTARLFALARQQGVAGPHVAAIELLSAALDRALGRHLTINATGAVAAVLGDVGVPAAIMRGFVLIARCAGLVGHVHEEQQHPAMVSIWEAAESAVPYQAVAGQPDPKGK